MRNFNPMVALFILKALLLLTVMFLLLGHLRADGREPLVDRSPSVLAERGPAIVVQPVVLAALGPHDEVYECDDVCRRVRTYVAELVPSPTPTEAPR